MGMFSDSADEQPGWSDIYKKNERIKELEKQLADIMRENEHLQNYLGQLRLAIIKLDDKMTIGDFKREAIQMLNDEALNTRSNQPGYYSASTTDPAEQRKKNAELRELTDNMPVANQPGEGKK